MKLKTVTIVDKHHGRRIINEKDYDPKAHQLFEEPEKQVAEPSEDTTEEGTDQSTAKKGRKAKA